MFYCLKLPPPAVPEIMLCVFAMHVKIMAPEYPESGLRPGYSVMPWAEIARPPCNLTRNYEAVFGHKIMVPTNSRLVHSGWYASAHLWHVLPRPSAAWNLPLVPWTWKFMSLGLQHTTMIAAVETDGFQEGNKESGSKTLCLIQLCLTSSPWAQKISKVATCRRRCALCCWEHSSSFLAFSLLSLCWLGYLAVPSVVFGTARILLERVFSMYMPNQSVPTSINTLYI